MKKIAFWAIFWLIVGLNAQAQELYHKWYGPRDAEQTLVFIHGGPGYNAAGFEFDMAPRLAKIGYQVLVFDQRGCGRSEKVTGQYNFAEAVEDIRDLMDAQGVKKANLLGHSFGGIVAVEFAHAHPEMVTSIVLISAPMDLPGCFRAIQRNCKIRFESNDDSTGIKSIDRVAKMDSSSLEYVSANFMYAMACGLYTPSESFKQGTKIKKKFKHSELGKWGAYSTQAPVRGFYDNEHYSVVNHADMLRQVAINIPVNGIFGEDDGLFDQIIWDQIEAVIGSEHFYLLSLSSHNVFLDDPYGFVDAFEEIMRNVGRN